MDTTVPVPYKSEGLAARREYGALGASEARVKRGWRSARVSGQGSGTTGAGWGLRSTHQRNPSEIPTQLAGFRAHPARSGLLTGKPRSSCDGEVALHTAGSSKVEIARPADGVVLECRQGT